MIKKTPTERFVKQGLHYTTLCNEVVQSIESGEALAIFTYLQTQSEGWIPRRKDIKDRLGFGDDRVSKGMKELRELGLVWDFTVRDDKGHIIEKVLVCGNLWKDIQDQIDALALSAENTILGATENAENLKCGKPISRENTTLNKVSITNKESTINKCSIDDAFETFYSAGLVKRGGPAKALAAFKRAAKGKDPAEFAEMLAADIQKRIAMGQFGIDRLHPTTYLNGERWKDDYPTESSSGANRKRLSTSERAAAAAL